MNQQREKVIKEFLNRAGIVVTELTPEIKIMFKSIDYIELVKPLIIQDRELFKIGQLAIRYGVDRAKVKYILYNGQKKPQKYY